MMVSRERRYSRPYRVALVTTTTLTLMFINAVLYT
jgi:hypothetical protein